MRNPPVVRGVAIRDGVSPVLVLGDLREQCTGAAGRRHDSGVGSGSRAGGRHQRADFLQHPLGFNSKRGCGRKSEH